MCARFNTSSGEEGVYPDLTKHAEKRLISIKPTSAILRKAEPVLRRNMLNSNERQEIDDDMNNWTCEMQSREKDLDKGKVVLANDFCAIQPAIREIKLDIAAVCYYNRVVKLYKHNLLTHCLSSKYKYKNLYFIIN